MILNKFCSILPEMFTKLDRETDLNGDSLDNKTYLYGSSVIKMKINLFLKTNFERGYPLCSGKRDEVQHCSKQVQALVTLFRPFSITSFSILHRLSINVERKL